MSKIITQQQPEFSTDAKGIGWLKFRSPAHAIAFQSQYAPLRDGQDTASDWTGLVGQSFSDYLESRVAKHALSLTRKAFSAIQDPRKTFSRPIASITGGYWSVPDVVQNIPLAARMRVRTKLAPVNLHFVTWYGSISDIAPIFPLAARLAHAIHAYTMAGGAVTLRVTAIADADDSQFTKVASSVSVPTSSLAEIATALSPTFHRCSQIPLRQCMQTVYASLPRTSNFIPGARELLGPKQALVAAFEKAIFDLKLS